MFSFAALFFVFFLYSLFTPIRLDDPVSFTINEGESLKSLTDRLKEEGLVSSPRFLRMYLSFNNKDTKVQLGEYEFTGELSLFALAREITERGPKNPLLSVTIPEGSTSLEVFQYFAKVLPALNKETFANLVEGGGLQGKLFPSTYYLLPSYKEENIISIMNDLYEKKMKPLLKEASLPQPLLKESDVIILASILEGEANTERDMKIVAGILLERMKIGMPLQVDVAMETYKKKGLPEKPINNPGLVAVSAVLAPVYTEYLYYITGKDGKMYYAKTFTEHKRNIANYLR